MGRTRRDFLRELIAPVAWVLRRSKQELMPAMALFEGSVVCVGTLVTNFIALLVLCLIRAGGGDSAQREQLPKRDICYQNATSAPSEQAA